MELARHRVSLFPEGMNPLVRYLLWGLPFLLGLYAVSLSPLYALFFAIGLLFVGLLLIKPFAGTVLMVLLLPVGTLQYTVMATVQGPFIQIWIIHVLAIPCLLAMVLQRLAGIGPKYQSTGFELPSFLLVLLAAFSLSWFPRDYPMLYSYWLLWRLLVCLALFFLAIGTITDRKKLNIILACWVFMGLATAIVAIISKFTGSKTNNILENTPLPLQLILYTGIPNPRIKGGARAGGFDLHDFISAYLNMYFFFTVGMLIVSKKTFIKILLFITLLLILLAEVMTFSRGGMVGFMAGAFFFVLLIPNLRKDFPKYMGIATMGFIALFLLVFGNNLESAYNRLAETFGSSEASGSKTRVDAVIAGWKMFIQAPFLGVGLGGFRIFAKIPHAHNYFISVLWDLGVIGYSLFIWQVVVVVKTIRKGMAKITDPFYQTMIRSFTAGILAFSFHSLVDFDYTWMQFLWLYVATLFCLIRIGLKESSKVS